MNRIKDMIRKATEQQQNEQGYSPGGLGFGPAEEGASLTTPVRPYRAVGNTINPASPDLSGREDRCRVIGYLPPSQQAVNPMARKGRIARG